MACSLAQAVAELVYSFEMTDEPGALDEALIAESGIQRAPLVSYGALRKLARAAHEHGWAFPTDAHPQPPEPQV